MVQHAYLICAFSNKEVSARRGCTFYDISKELSWSLFHFFVDRRARFASPRSSPPPMSSLLGWLGKTTTLAEDQRTRDREFEAFTAESRRKEAKKLKLKKASPFAKHF